MSDDIRAIDGFLSISSDSLTEQIADLVGELVWEHIQDTTEMDDFEIVGWEFLIPEIRVEYTINVKEIS